VACDMPFITTAIIEQLADYRFNVKLAQRRTVPLALWEGLEFQAVVPVVQGYPQPLAAFYATRILDELHELQCGSGKQSLRELLKKLTVRYVNETEMQAAELGSFFDLDTPEDVALAINMKGVSQWNT